MKTDLLETIKEALEAKEMFEMPKHVWEFQTKEGELFYAFSYEAWHTFLRLGPHLTDKPVNLPKKTLKLNIRNYHSLVAILR